MNLVHNGTKLGILVVQSVHCVHSCVEVLHILGVHLEEGCVLHHDVSYPLVLGTLLPFVHTFFELKVVILMTG